MSYETWLDERMDYITGTPCLNCESDPAEPESLFCTDECADEYNGEGEYAEHPADCRYCEAGEGMRHNYEPPSDT